MNILPYEKMELVVKTLVEEFKGFEIIVHPISSNNKPGLRVVLFSTPYVADSAIRKISQTGRIFFVEVPINHQRLNPEGIAGLFSEAILNVLKRHASSGMVAPLENIDLKTARPIPVDEWKELSREYNISLEEYKNAPLDKFPFVKIKPRSEKSNKPSIYLTEPYSYAPSS